MHLDGCHSKPHIDYFIKLRKTVDGVVSHKKTAKWDDDQKALINATKKLPKNLWNFEEKWLMIFIPDIAL